MVGRRLSHYAYHKSARRDGSVATNQCDFFRTPRGRSLADFVPRTDDSVEKIDSQTHEIHSRSRSEQQVTIGNQQFIKSKLPEYATKNLTEHELEMQQLLTAYIPCPSYALWLKQEQGWRCAAGQHWITDEQVERLAKGEHPDNVRWQTGYGPKSNWTNPPHPEDFHAQIWETSARRCRLGVWGR